MSNEVDAICTQCHQPFRWPPVSLMICGTCRLAQPDHTFSADALFTASELEAIGRAALGTMENVGPDELEVLWQRAAAIRLANQRLTEVIHGRMGISLRDDSVVFYRGASGDSPISVDG